MRAIGKDRIPSWLIARFLPPLQSAPTSAGAARKSVQVHTRGPLVGRRSTAHVVLRVEGCEPTEGHARLVGQLNQVQGVFDTQQTL